MKTTANRLIVIAAGVFALGTAAFGQNRVTAEIPFAFKTASATLPAGTYEFTRVQSTAISNVVTIRNVATSQQVLAGNPLFTDYNKATDKPIAEFACGKDGCALKALRTNAGSVQYPAPHHAKDHEKVAVISIPMKPVSGE
jgi:hypothetical protein